MTPEDRSRPDMRLGLVGVGALGSELARLLIAQGHANVSLIDPDQLQPHNLAMSELFRRAQAELNPAHGSSKVELVRRMAALKGLSWDALPVEIADVGWADLARCDLLICCADSVLARVETAGAARSLGLPMLEAAVSSLGGSQGECPAFLPTHSKPATFAVLRSTGARGPGLRALRVTGLHARCRFSWHDGERADSADCGSGSPSPGCKPHSAGSVCRTSRCGNWRQIALSRSATCPWHQLTAASELESLPFDEPFANAFQRLPPDAVLEFFWPVCLRSRCTHCGQITPDARRPALIRRKGICQDCATEGNLETLECVQSIHADDPRARLTPSQLGLPQRHLYYWRPGAQACHRDTSIHEFLFRTIRAVCRTSGSGQLAAVWLWAGRRVDRVACRARAGVGITLLWLHFNPAADKPWLPPLLISLAVLLSTVILELALHPVFAEWFAFLFAAAGSGATMAIVLRNRRRCNLCSRSLSTQALTFRCPRCSQEVCEETCWNFEFRRCELCQQQRVPLLPIENAWWTRVAGPQVRQGRCQVCLVAAEAADLRACPKCRRLQCRDCWDFHNGDCTRCSTPLPDLPPALSTVIGSGFKLDHTS